MGGGALPYLNEEEFGFPHQRHAAVAPEERGEALQFYGAVGAKEHAFVAVAQQDADEGRRTAVIVLRH